MKKIKILLLVLLISICLISCEEDKGSGKLDTSNLSDNVNISLIKEFKKISLSENKAKDLEKFLREKLFQLSPWSPENLTKKLVEKSTIFTLVPEENRESSEISIYPHEDLKLKGMFYRMGTMPVTANMYYRKKIGSSYGPWKNAFSGNNRYSKGFDFRQLIAGSLYSDLNEDGFREVMKNSKTGADRISKVLKDSGIIDKKGEILIRIESRDQLEQLLFNNREIDELYEDRDIIYEYLQMREYYRIGYGIYEVRIPYFLIDDIDGITKDEEYQIKLDKLMYFDMHSGKTYEGILGDCPSNIINLKILKFDKKEEKNTAYINSGYYSTESAYYNSKSVLKIGKLDKSEISGKMKQDLIVELSYKGKNIEIIGELEADEKNLNTFMMSGRAKSFDSEENLTYNLELKFDDDVKIISGKVNFFPNKIGEMLKTYNFWNLYSNATVDMKPEINYDVNVEKSYIELLVNYNPSSSPVWSDDDRNYYVELERIKDKENLMTLSKNLDDYGKDIKVVFRMPFKDGNYFFKAILKHQKDEYKFAETKFSVKVGNPPVDLPKPGWQDILIVNMKMKALPGAQVYIATNEKDENGDKISFLGESDENGIFKYPKNLKNPYRMVVTYSSNNVMIGKEIFLTGTDPASIKFIILK